MRNYMNPEMNISKFSVTDVVTTSGEYTENTGITNLENAKAFLATKSNLENAGNIMQFK